MANLDCSTTVVGMRDNYLYLHLFFLTVGGDLLPVVTYYVLRDEVVFQVNPETYKETPTGDAPIELMGCKSLGEYSRKKIMVYDFGYIDVKKMLEVMSIQKTTLEKL